MIFATSESPVFLKPRFTIIERIIQQEDNKTRTQLIWDRRQESFVVIAALTENKKFVLVEEPKYGIMERILNLPAGGIEKESPEEAAKRELLEETGFISSTIVLLRSGIIDFANMVAGGEHSFFLAVNAKRIRQPSEELINPVLLNSNEAKSILMGSHPSIKIVTAISLSCLAAAVCYLEL